MKLTEMFVITFTFANGGVNTLSNESYEQVAKWYSFFTQPDVMADANILEAILRDVDGNVIAAKTGRLTQGSHKRPDVSTPDAIDGGTANLR